MQRILLRRWFLIGLLLVLAAGFLFSAPLAGPASLAPRKLIVASVLFLMALPLESRAMWQTLRRPGPPLLGIAVNFGLVPLLAWTVAPLLPGKLGIGLLIMAAIPCTLASAAIWTRRAGGNDAVAILVTLTTNLAAFAVTPALLRLMTHTETTLDFGKMTARLVLVVLLPILAAQMLRRYRPLATWATARKTTLGVVCQCGILSMVLLGSVKAGVALADGTAGYGIGLGNWIVMLAAVVTVHLAALGAGHGLSHLMGFTRHDRIAVGFAGSQKTLMVGLDIGLQFYGGLTILPMVAYHVSQLLVDTLIADRLRAAEKEKKRLEARG